MTNKEYFAYCDEIINSLSREEKERLKETINMASCDFMGNFEIYDHLSKIIPKDHTVIDFGAAYNFQSYFFKDFKRYIAVEPPCMHKEFKFGMFCPQNCEIYRMTTKEFIETVDYPKEKVFAICNYVPNWCGQDSTKLVHDNFRNCFTFYPS